MKKLTNNEMQYVQGGIKAPGAWLVCLGGTLVSIAIAAPLGLVELAACGYTLYKNW